MLIISTEVLDQVEKIVGPVIVYFESGNALSVNTIRSRDYSDGSATTIFLMTASQIKQFINSNIKSIRFNKAFLTNAKEGVTVFNNYDVFAGMNNYGLPYYTSKVNETSSDVQKLFY